MIVIYRLPAKRKLIEYGSITYLRCLKNKTLNLNSAQNIKGHKNN